MVQEVATSVFQNPIMQALMWAAGVMLTIIAWFIIRELSRQTKKDEEQDAEIDKMGRVLERTNEILGGMQKMLQEHETNIQWLIKSIEKSTRR